MSYDLLRMPGVVVSFDTKPTAILPMSYKNVEVVGMVNYAIAIGIEDVTAKYQQVIPYIPDINKDFSKVEYVIIRHNSGELEVLALPWIAENTIQSTTIVNRVIKLFNIDSAADARIAKMLRLNGFTEFTIENA